MERSRLFKIPKGFSSEHEGAYNVDERPCLLFFPPNHPAQASPPPSKPLSGNNIEPDHGLERDPTQQTLAQVLTHLFRNIINRTHQKRHRSLFAEHAMFIPHSGGLPFLRSREHIYLILAHCFVHISGVLESLL